MSMTKLLTALVLLGALWPAGAQIELNPPKPASAIAVDVDLVNVLCSVRDQHGAYIKALNKEDFEIRQDGKRQAITHFAREVDSPMTVALLLDVSARRAGIIGTEKGAAERFFDEVLRPGDQALLVGFAQVIAVWQELTPSKELLQSTLRRAGPGALPTGNPEIRPRGGTLLYDAVNLVASRKLRGLPGRKTIILITDGLDNGSIANIATAVEAAHGADAVVYCIHYEDEERVHYSGGRGISALEKLSEPTGGRTFRASRKMPLEEIFHAIGEGMRNQYGLGFTPPAEGKEGAFHKLEVKSTKAGLKAQARTGYYSGRR
jgi:Ca-activated chloride channel family protein